MIHRGHPLTAYLVAADTVVTGIYGMNFDNMPELHTRYGYFVCIAFMLVLDTLLYRKYSVIPSASCPAGTPCARARAAR
jgi:hypothetical protein